jgi:hypothetical protein
MIIQLTRKYLFLLACCFGLLGCTNVKQLPPGTDCSVLWLIGPSGLSVGDSGMYTVGVSGADELQAQLIFKKPSFQYVDYDVVVNFDLVVLQDTTVVIRYPPQIPVVAWQYEFVAPYVGDYIVRATVTNRFGASDTKSTAFTVLAKQ